MGMRLSTRSKKKKFHISHNTGKASALCFDDFQILRAIGKGTFGKVCIVQKKDNMNMYAMKYMNKNQCVENHAFKNVLKEIELLSTLEHPFLVNLWFTFQDEEDMFMVVDLLLGGDLRYHLTNGSSNFNNERITLYLCEIGLALDYLRSKTILHRDIKPENILLDDDGHAHITDFNIATMVTEKEKATAVSGTKPYMAPEIVLCALDSTNGYSFPADWWSLGVTAYEMLCRKRPYDIQAGSSVEEIYEMITNTCIRFPKSIDKTAASFVKQLLCTDPDSRISCVDHMKKHSFFKCVDFDAVYNGKVTSSFIPNKNQLNCDPTFELEEMIIEAKPLHKKKKRLSKRNKSRKIPNEETSEAMQKSLDSIQEKFIIYNRESSLQQQRMAEKETIWEEELRKVTE